MGNRVCLQAVNNQLHTHASSKTGRNRHLLASYMLRDVRGGVYALCLCVARSLVQSGGMAPATCRKTVETILPYCTSIKFNFRSTSGFMTCSTTQPQLCTAVEDDKQGCEQSRKRRMSGVSCICLRPYDAQTYMLRCSHTLLGTYASLVCPLVLQISVA